MNTSTRKYLIVSREVPALDGQIAIVNAESDELAIQKYLRKIYAQDADFRESILDLAVNMTFSERFYLATEHEQNRFLNGNGIGTEDEIIKSRVMTFFADMPELGKKFTEYMDTENRSLITDDIFEYIALRETPDQHGKIAVDLATIPCI